MYNEEIKQKYMSTLNDTDRRLVAALFNRIEKYEQEYKRDFYAMNRSQIIKTIAEFGSQSNIRPAFSRLRKYSKWAKENKIHKGINYSDEHITTVKELIQSIGQCEKRYYISEEEYRRDINILKTSENAVYLTSLFMACYEGILGNHMENLIHLRVSDLRQGTHITLFDGSKRNISEELRSLLIEASTVEYLYGKYTASFKYSLYPDTIWKGTRKGNNQKRKFMSMFDNTGKIKDLLDNENITMEALYRSGFFNFVKKRAKELGYDLRKDMTEDIIQVRTHGDKGRLTASKTTERYDKIFQEYGSNYRLYNFKRDYADWVSYI